MRGTLAVAVATLAACGTRAVDGAGLTTDYTFACDVAEDYGDRLPHAHYRVVEEVGHLVPEEDPHNLSRLILALA